MRTEERVLSQDYWTADEIVSLPGVDLVVAGATWDRRCIELIKFDFDGGFDRALLLKYADKGSSGRVRHHEDLLETFLRQSARMGYLETEIVARSVNDSWAAIRQQLVNSYESVGRPLRIAIDLNSVPRYISLGMLGLGARTGIVSQCDAFYSTTTGYEPHDSTISEGFTFGEWLPVAVATLGSGAPPNSTSHLVVSAGFEGQSTRRLVNALEPDRISLALSSGISDANDRVARHANAGLAEDYLLDSRSIITCSMLDIRDTVRQLQAISQPIIRESGPPEFASFLLCGPKPVSLAIALVAIDSPIAHVYYPSPEAHVENDVIDVTGTLVAKILL